MGIRSGRKAAREKESGREGSEKLEDGKLRDAGREGERETRSGKDERGGNRGEKNVGLLAK